MEDNTLYQGGNEQGFADPVTENEGLTVGTEDEGGKGQEVADPVQEAEGNESKTQSKEANAAFAQIRRRAEEAERQAAESRDRVSRMTGILNRLGFEGESPEAAADSALSHVTGKPVEEIRREREAAQQHSQLTQALIAEVEALRGEKAQREVDEDLKRFKAIDPELKDVEDLEKRYPAFLEAIRNLSDEDKRNSELRELLFRSAVGMREAKKIKPPPAIGRLNTKTEAEKDFFTEKELNYLEANPEKLDDPKVREKAIRSMTKLKKL